jgi:hypothetical protein
METTPEFSTQELLVARHSIEAGRDGVVLPSGYLNFDLALAILDGCRDAITMADAHNPSTVIERLETATKTLALLQSGVAEASVKTARAHIDATISKLHHDDSVDKP